jgi:hypothetical protein
MKWQSEPISETCEVIMDFQRRFCGELTTHIYPAHPRGYMAPCREHAKAHPEAWPLAETDEQRRCAQ